tara:strand:+ start:3730 stop:4713 length:984 start_codon:yes stop_codon:yes gene_type:complete
MLATAAIATLIIAAAAVLLICFGSTWFITPKRRALESRHHELLANPADFGLRIEALSVTMKDGVVLETILATRAPNPGRAEKTRRMSSRLERGGITPSPAPRGTIILLHGRGGRKEDMLSIAQRFVAADYRCIVYDARAHGKSQGRFCTFGVHEVIDLTSVLDYYSQHFETEGSTLGPVGAFGNSLGASIVLQSLTSESRIIAAVAVAPFAELPDIVVSSGRRKIHPQIPAWVIHSAMKLGGLRAGFDPFSIAPIQHTAQSATPIFLTHGTLDEVIPIDHSRRLAKATSASTMTWREIHSGYHYNILAEGGDDLYEEMIHFFLTHTG